MDDLTTRQQLRIIRDHTQVLHQKLGDLAQNGYKLLPAEEYRNQLHALSVEAKNISDHILELWRKQ